MASAAVGVTPRIRVKVMGTSRQFVNCCGVSAASVIPILGVMEGYNVQIQDAPLS